MTKAEAFEAYWQGVKDTDAMVTEAAARTYFEQWWIKRRVHRDRVSYWIDDD